MGLSFTSRVLAMKNGTFVRSSVYNLYRNIPMVKLTWLVLGGDPAARSHRVEQLTAL